MASSFSSTRLAPAGYAHLIERLRLEVIPNWHESYIARSGSHRTDTFGSLVRETYIWRYWPGDSVGAHLEFALKYDGVNLAVLAEVFRAVDTAEIEAYVQSKPTGKYARRVWFLYEMITGVRLEVDDLKRGSYVDLLDASLYFTATAGNKVRRQRINDNLLGDRRFCPTIRRTDRILQLIVADLPKRCADVVRGYSSEQLRRALVYLYTKETKSSFQIENIQPSANRTERFINLLQLAEREDFVDRQRFVDLQNRIVDPRFANPAYRTSQNYVGESVAWQGEQIHHVGPKPDDLEDLMAGLISSHRRMMASEVEPVAHAAAIAYAFVFLHPFDDGNGRIHRFLIHNILARRGFSPKGLMFPVSATMLKNPNDYDASLEAFSKPLLQLVEYSLDEDGQMTVHNDTCTWFRFMDMTAQVEALLGFVEETIDTELLEELRFLANYDRTKKAIQGIVDMPDRQIDLFIRFCLQNRGQLGRRKRVSHFAFLTDDEATAMERAVRAGYLEDAGGQDV